jgi:hypothetical protein
MPVCCVVTLLLQGPDSGAVQFMRALWHPSIVIQLFFVLLKVLTVTL